MFPTVAATVCRPWRTSSVASRTAPASQVTLTARHRKRERNQDGALARSDPVEVAQESAQLGEPPLDTSRTEPLVPRSPMGELRLGHPDLRLDEHAPEFGARSRPV